MLRWPELPSHVRGERISAAIIAPRLAREQLQRGGTIITSISPVELRARRVTRPVRGRRAESSGSRGETPEHRHSSEHDRNPRRDDDADDDRLSKYRLQLDARSLHRPKLVRLDRQQSSKSDALVLGRAFALPRAGPELSDQVGCSENLTGCAECEPSVRHAIGAAADCRSLNDLPERQRGRNPERFDDRDQPAHEADNRGNDHRVDGLRWCHP